jgi:tripartite-type tricarboxylate transporter receptor subunit TctC
MLKVKADIDILHVPYRGHADALNDLLANNVQMMDEINPMPHVRAGKFTLLDISYPERHPDFPDVPTLWEVGYGDAYVPSWYSIWAPAGTPQPIIDTMNTKMAAIAKTPDMKARLLTINVSRLVQTPEERRRQLAEDTQRNAELINSPTSRSSDTGHGQSDTRGRRRGAPCAPQSSRETQRARRGDDRSHQGRLH